MLPQSPSQKTSGASPRILRVCGLHPVWYHTEKQLFHPYLLSSSETLDIHEFKYPKTELAHCAASLFYNITEDDTYVFVEEGHSIRLMLRKLKRSIGVK